ncbi:MAG: aldo/keto reductase, partial [Oscillospiraceae bacterium]
MKKFKIGGELESSILAQGCMRQCRVSLHEADKVIHTALECGINFFDHADVYGFGAAEEVFGKVLNLKSDIRSKILIQSKCTLHRDEVQTLYNDQSKEYIISSVEASLKRLNTDYLDTFLLHAPDTLVEPDEVAEAFEQLHTSGKVRYFGVSNHMHLQIELLQKYLKQRLIINQLQFSVAHTDLIDSSITMRLRDSRNIDKTGDVLTYTRIHDMTVQAWSPFQYGFYGGVFMGCDKFPKLNASVNRMAEEKGVSPSAIAIAWLLRHPAKIQPLIGTTNAERLQDICTATEVEMTGPEWYELYRMSLSDEGKD